MPAVDMAGMRLVEGSTARPRKGGESCQATVFCSHAPNKCDVYERTCVWEAAAITVVA